jgi:hypothetical protein
MRFPRVRFTVRRMMVAVAIIGIVVWLGIAGGRHWRYRRLAASYASKESLARNFSSGELTATRITFFLKRPCGESTTSVMAHLGYYAEMRAKYDHAARHPWLPVAPDPPEPK